MRRLLLFTCAVLSPFSLFNQYHAPFLFPVKNMKQHYVQFIPFSVAYADDSQANDSLEEIMEDSVKESLCKAHRHPAILWHPALPGIGIRTYKYDKGYEWCRDYLAAKKKETN